MKIVQVDAFSGVAFKGNPAAVCVLEAMPEEEQMQLIAREMNLSETAFVVPMGESEYEIRWFTPSCEVELCGHATLASAHVLWENDHEPGTHVSFRSKGGPLSAQRGEDGWIELDFPAKPPQECEPPTGLLEGLGVLEPEFIGRSQYDYLVAVANLGELSELSPDLGAIAKVEARGVIVTAPDGQDFDFQSRFFAPAAGVNEDPVTGSAHCVLAPYWSQRLGKTELRAYQASQRGGSLRLRHRDERVILGGQAVTVMRGELLLG